MVELAQHLWLGDMSHLARVNRWLYQILDPILYLMDAKPYNQHALFWTAEHNLLAVAERALRAGTPSVCHGGDDGLWLLGAPLRDISAAADARSRR
ncbi:hypothetical protein MY8738_006932 [Beauveria namnaoensis]